MNIHDDLYAAPLDSVPNFRFDNRVAAVFDDMIRRSVPGYANSIDLTGRLAGHYVPEQGRAYDLGCSLGAGTQAMHRHMPHSAQIDALDNAPAMLEKLQLAQHTWPAGCSITLTQADICHAPLAPCHFVALNWTLQFIEPSLRAPLLAKIAHVLAPGGALVLSEKVLCEDPAQEALQQWLHTEFKRRQGYSELEIAQKRAAIENVLIAETLATHHQRLQQAGFRSVEVCFRSFNFLTLVALK